MKKQFILEKVFQMWVIGIGLLALFGIAVAVFNLITGNYGHTASFEF
jgi:hypothetical protein